MKPNGGKKSGEEKKEEKGKREREKNFLLLLVFRYVVNSSGWFKCVECEGKKS